MNCEDVSSQLPELVDGELSAEDRRALEGHLDGCPRCREELAVLKACWDALDDDECPEVSSGFARAFWWRAGRARRLRWIAAAAGVLLAVGGVWFAQAQRETRIDNNIIQVVDEPQDVDVISDLDILDDLDVIMALQEEDEQSST